MQRGEIWLVDLDPGRGAEALERRPAVIVANDAARLTAARLGRGVVTVVPLTSNVTKVYPFQVLLPAGECGTSADAKAQAEQVRSIAVERLAQPIGRAPASIMAQLDEALRLHPAL